MTDEQLALHAISEAQLLLEDYLQTRPQNNQNNEGILDKLVEVLERPDLVVAVSRLPGIFTRWMNWPDPEPDLYHHPQQRPFPRRHRDPDRHLVP